MALNEFQSVCELMSHCIHVIIVKKKIEEPILLYTLC